MANPESRDVAATSPPGRRRPGRSGDRANKRPVECLREFRTKILNRSTRTNERFPRGFYRLPPRISRGFLRPYEYRVSNGATSSGMSTKSSSEIVKPRSGSYSFSAVTRADRVAREKKKGKKRGKKGQGGEKVSKHLDLVALRMYKLSSETRLGRRIGQVEKML